MEKLLPENNFVNLVQSALIATAAIFIFFLWESHAGLNLADGGFLWYGAQRVTVGDVPLRDFASYDPGRYYWCAAIMHLMGSDGIIALRVATTLFQGLGLFIALALVSRRVINTKLLFWPFVATTTLVIWMWLPYKMFDITVSIVLVGTLAFLVERPSSQRYFLAGLSVGLVAVFGRNHGLYGLIGGLGVMIYLAYARESGPTFIRALGAWLAGIFIGYLPILIMSVIFPGFASAFWDGIHYILFEFKGTDLPLPIPWPWRVPFGRLPWIEAVRGELIGLFFIAIVAFGVLGIAWAFVQKKRKKQVSSPLVASAFMALPYAHYAYSRADVEHLSLGIFPFLIGCLAILSIQPAKYKWPFASLLCGASLLLLLPLHPGWQCHVRHRCTQVDVAGSKLEVPYNVAINIAFFNKLNTIFSPGNRSFIVAPYFPGAYALLHKKSPMWDIYPILPRSGSFQEREIQRIKKANPGFDLIIDNALDGRDELRFSKTHSVIDQYIRDNFDRVPSPDPVFKIYKSRR